MTPLNILISNLALSDCLLCVVNVPSTLIEICCVYWPLRDDFDELCKFFGLSQGLLIFVSTITIVVIAVDRYQVNCVCYMISFIHACAINILNVSVFGTIIIIINIYFKSDFSL